jgi:hypothetical protein
VNGPNSTADGAATAALDGAAPAALDAAAEAADAALDAADEAADAALDAADEAADAALDPEATAPSALEATVLLSCFPWDLLPSPVAKNRALAPTTAPAIEAAITTFLVLVLFAAFGVPTVDWS